MKVSVLITRALSLILAGSITCNTYAQYDCSVKNFNTSNGLPQNTIRGMCFDKSGYLWLGSQNGLIRYDGTNFKPFFLDPKKSRTDRANGVLRIPYIRQDDQMLIRAGDGRVYTIEDGVPALYSAKINNSNYYYQLVGSFPSIAMFDKFNLPISELTTLKHGWNPNIKNILPVNRTDLILLSEKKNILFLYKNGNKTGEIELEYAQKDFFRSGNYAFLRDIRSNIYLYDPKTDKFVSVHTEWGKIKKKTDSLDSTVIHWDTYNDQSYCFYNSTFYLISFDASTTTIKFIPKFTINERKHFWTGILYDSISSTYFLSTLTEGLFQVKTKYIQTFELTDLMPQDRPPDAVVNYSLLKTSDSTVLTPSGFEFTNTSHGVTVNKKGKIWGNRQTLALLNDNSILVSEKNTLFYYSPLDGYTQKRGFNNPFNLRNRSYISLLKVEGDSVWVCTNTSISYISRNKETILFKRKADEETIYFGPCLFYRLNKDEAYFSNFFGLYRLKTSAPQRIDTIAVMKGKQIRHISRYKDMLILSAYKDGLYVLKNDIFYPVKLHPEQSALNFCHSTYIDNKGHVWITTDKGLFRSTVQDIVGAALRSDVDPFFFYYGQSDGIKNSEFNGSGTPAYVVLDNGRLFYPSMGGIVSFDPKDLNEKISSGPIPVENIYMGDHTTNARISDTIYLQPDFKYLSIELNVPNFGEPKNLVLEYNLDDLGWKQVEILNTQRLVISNLSAGYHKLTIRKHLGSGGSEYVYKTMTIHREKHLYERLWFYPAILLALILLIMLVINLKTRRINNNRRQLQKLVDEQTSELSKTVEIKEMLINIISHDMISPLKHISFIAGVLGKGLETDPEKVTEALIDIRATSDKIVSGSLGIINWMRYNNSHVAVNKKLLNVRNIINEIFEIFDTLARKKDISLINDVPASQMALIDHNIFSIVLNNIVSNAVKYSNKGEIRVYMEKGPAKQLYLRIKDTGPGINKHILDVINELLKGNIQILASTNKAGTGLGYILISELIKIHDMAVTVDAELNVGTTVSIQLQ